MNAYPYRAPQPEPAPCRGCRVDFVFGLLILTSVIMSGLLSIASKDRSIPQIAAFVWMVLHLFGDWSPLDVVGYYLLRHIKHTCEKKGGK